jgi:integrase
MLTASAIDSLPVPKDRQIRKFQDGNGLFLQIDSRSKGWRFRYRFAGKDSLMSLGPYPAVSPEAAREQATAIRAQLSKGENPAEARRRSKDAQWTAQANTFGVVAAGFIKSQAHAAEKTRERHARMFRHSSRLHGRTLESLTRPDILALLRTFEQIGKRETAHRLGIFFSQVFRFARDDWYAGPDPTAGGFGKSLAPARAKNRAAITEPRAVGKLMCIVDDTLGLEYLGANVRNALRLIARTFVRPGELANAEWSEFDLDGEHHKGAATWVIPLHRMKIKDDNRTDHIVPLSTQAVEILRAQFELTGHSKYVFTNGRTDARPMSDGAMSAALCRLTYAGEHMPHGFRTTAKTLIQDVLKVESELVERQLAHKVGSGTASAYDKSQRLDERRQMMQAYNNLLDQLRDAGKV